MSIEIPKAIHVISVQRNLFNKPPTIDLFGHKIKFGVSDNGYIYSDIVEIVKKDNNVLAFFCELMDNSKGRDYNIVENVLDLPDNPLTFEPNLSLQKLRNVENVNFLIRLRDKMVKVPDRKKRDINERIAELHKHSNAPMTKTISLSKKINTIEINGLRYYITVQDNNLTIYNETYKALPKDVPTAQVDKDGFPDYPSNFEGAFDVENPDVPVAVMGHSRPELDDKPIEQEKLKAHPNPKKSVKPKKKKKPTKPKKGE